MTALPRSRRSGTHRRPSQGRAGFTLIEILAVLLILSILIGILVTSLFNAGEAANGKLTEARLAQLETAIGRFENETGDYPPSTFDALAGATGSANNRGIEAAIHALYEASPDGYGMGDDVLDNLDGDTLGGMPLLELVDLWGNPVAYLRRQDYGTPQPYVTFDGTTGEQVDNLVDARKHPKTGRWANHTSFQLISAGADGIFNTEDDLGNFLMD